MNHYQMYADYDQLFNYFKKYNIRIITKKLLFNIDIIKEMIKLREEIPKIKNKKEFVILIKNVLMLQQGGHTSISTYDINEMKISDLQKTMLNTLNKKYKKYGNTHYKNEFWFPILYYNGNYIIYKNIFYNKSIIPANAYIILVNGIPIDKFIQSLFTEKLLSWDKKFKKFYCTDFYKSKSICKNKVFSLTFKYNENILTYSFKFNQNIIKPPFYKKNTNPLIYYYKDEKLLYIRIPIFNNIDYYIENIKKYKNNEINKVVLDIRGNPGGIPKYAYQIISLIIDEEISFTQTMLLKYKPEITELYLDFLKIQDTLYTNQLYPLLGISNAFIIKRCYTIFPDTGSLKYGGLIYIFSDEDANSMAYNLVQIANQNDKLLSVGIPSSIDHGGLGLTYRSSHLLSNSMIVFESEDSFTITGVINTNSMYHNDIEIYIPYSWDELVYRKTNESLIYTSNYLINNDPMIKYIKLLNTGKK